MGDGEAHALGRPHDVVTHSSGPLGSAPRAPSERGSCEVAQWVDQTRGAGAPSTLLGRRIGVTRPKQGFSHSDIAQEQTGSGSPSVRALGRVQCFHLPAVPVVAFSTLASRDVDAIGGVCGIDNSVLAAVCQAIAAYRRALSKVGRDTGVNILRPIPPDVQVLNQSAHHALDV
jgi:hypothetical protein